MNFSKITYRRKKEKKARRNR